MFENSRIAVLDLTHGGTAIARELKKIAESVTGIDVYKTLTLEGLSTLEKEGIKTSQTPLNAADFDILIAPVHLDPDYPMLVDAVKSNLPVLSHHGAVGMILSKYDLKDKTIIEITGTKAKTSTSILLAEILSKDNKVVSHTSRGLKYWSTGKIIKKGLSITPGSILTALDALKGAKIEPEVIIFEISLGGTGRADIGVITSITDDYQIANNKRPASDAKRQMILNAKPGSSLVINHDALRFFGACRRDLNIISFSDTVNAASNVYYEDISSRGGKIAFYIGKRNGKISIPDNSGYDVDSYRTAMVCATAIALAMNVDVRIIEALIKDFKGAEGRMKKSSFKGRTLIDNSNSGMDIRIAEKALSYAKSAGGRIMMVLGEEAREVCEGLEPSGVKDFIRKHLDELGGLILVGERMKPLININIDKIYYTDDLSKGIELAVELSHEKDIILSCVKCFR